MSLPNKNSYSNLGGELQDYSPVTDPTTDLSAQASNEMRADVAAMTRTAVRAWVAFTVTGTSVDVANTDFDAVYGNAQAYKPTGVYNDIGDYTITFPSSVVDARGITQSINFSVGWINMDIDNGNGYFASAQRVSANVFRVFVWSVVDGQKEDFDNGKACLFVM